jgi:hypothetical protein
MQCFMLECASINGNVSLHFRTGRQLHEHILMPLGKLSKFSAIMWNAGNGFLLIVQRFTRAVGITDCNVEFVHPMHRRQHDAFIVCIKTVECFTVNYRFRSVGFT